MHGNDIDLNRVPKKETTDILGKAKREPKSKQYLFHILEMHPVVHLFLIEKRTHTLMSISFGLFRDEIQRESIFRNKSTRSELGVLVDGITFTNQISRDAARLRAAGRAATEIYEDIYTILDNQTEGSSNDALQQTMEKCRQLAIFSFITGKAMDQDAKESVIKAIDLPPALQSFDEAEDEGKDFMFSPNQDKRIHTERFNRQLLKQGSSVNKLANGNGAGFGNQQRGRGSYRGAGRGATNTQRSGRPTSSLCRLLEQELIPFHLPELEISPQDRWICDQVEQQATGVLELPPGSRSSGDRCIPTDLATDGALSVPSLEVTTSSHSETSSRQGQERLVISPLWPTQFWWPQLVTQALGPPLKLHLSKHEHLAAWMLSGMTLAVFLARTQKYRSVLGENHSLLLTYLNHDTKSPGSIAPKTVAQRLTSIMKVAGIKQGFTAHSIRSASSTATFQQGIDVNSIKLHANWALSSDTFERYYLKPNNQLVKASDIMTKVFLKPRRRNHISVGAKASTVVVDFVHPPGFLQEP
ncbi:hypothetical protein BC941DRAFT_456889 [Chlamydoabsidia padenii]|nr:hypothetical protein BC941DRAFT_456889 [Chlamydoabsidia padenii]